MEDLSRCPRGKTGLKGKYLETLKEFAALNAIPKVWWSRWVRDSPGRNIPDPVQAGMTVPCSYCDYRAICGHEPSGRLPFECPKEPWRM